MNLYIVGITYVTEKVSRGHFFLALFFRTAHPSSGFYHMERGGMLLHDAVGINCKKGATTENQGSGVKYLGQGVNLDDCMCVLSDLT